MLSENIVKSCSPELVAGYLLLNDKTVSAINITEFFTHIYTDGYEALTENLAVPNIEPPQKQCSLGFKF